MKIKNDRNIVEDLRDVIKFSIGEFNTSVTTETNLENSVEKRNYLLSVPIRDLTLCKKLFFELDNYISLLFKSESISKSSMLGIDSSKNICDWYLKLYRPNGDLFIKMTFTKINRVNENVESNSIIDSILEDMYNIIKDTIPSEVYSFKGGFILSRILNSNEKTKGIRRTKDIDLSVLGKDYFNLIVNSLKSYLDRLVSKGIIVKYVFKEPKVDKNLKRSGSIDLYAGNQKRPLCGIDISYQPLDYGLIRVSDGSTRYSFERMLSDKLCVMFSDEYTLTRRIRDVLDIYLINLFNKVDNEESYILNDLLLECVRKRALSNKIDFSKESTLDKLIRNDCEYLLFKFKSLIGDEKVDSNFLRKSDSMKIIKWVSEYINIVRNSL